ncbi:hypothetical protein JIQ42_01485 [Leishmania sp. Namibia]|uniref:hypothetical protein n=1 Tax=Leishmania sp. Namibia TaxID=2802991 RepID=UPI001B54584F|nr:hypothetical protein JIQ42_01485 [Leishmania sp. Namibia]
MSSRVDEPTLASFTKEPVTARQGACAIVYEAVCAEALRVIFALYALSRSGVAELGDALRHCRTVISGDGHSPLELLDLFAPQHHAGGASPVQWAPSRKGAYLRSHLRQGREEVCVLFSSAEARECIAHASLHGLLTAAHLLRCSTWTAESLVPGAWSERQSAPPQVSQLLARARAAEELRTRESAWCATVLVQLTEWLLLSRKPQFPSSLMSTLPSRALSVAEVERAVIDRCDPFSRSPCPPSSTNEAVHGVSTLVTRQRAVFVADPLPLYFPILANQKEYSRVSVSSSWPPSSAAVTLESGCVHRWLLDDLPRWCVHVALEEQCRVWHRTSLLRRALEQWRARRGVRVIAHLARAAMSSPPAEPPQSALATDSFRPLSYAGVSPYSGTPKAGERALPLRARLTDDSEAVTLSHAVTKQTAADTPRSGKVDSRDTGEPSSCSFGGVPDADVLTIALDTAPPPSLQRQYRQQTNPPAAAVLPHSGDFDASVSASTTRRLDSVLRGEPTMRESASSRHIRADEGAGARSEEGGQDQHQQQNPPRQERGDPEGSLAASVPASTPSSAHSPSSGKGCTRVSSHLTSVAALAFSDREAPQEELAYVMARRRERAVVHMVFILWRDRRLYESMAARFLQVQWREVTRARCWAQWRRRRAAILQHDKEVRDVARCDVYTERKALLYFQALLQRWKLAALARRFRLSTLGHRVFRSWQCNTRFAQAQRAIHQQLIGAHRVKWQVWTRWRERRQESVAARYRAQKHGAATLLLMKGTCARRQASHVARSQSNAATLQRALQRWVLRCTIAARLRNFIESRLPRQTRARQAWSTWRSRWLQQQLRQAQEHRLHAFRVAHLTGVCFARWVQRWRRETCIRVCVARQQRCHLLRVVFLQWQQRLHLCAIVRYGQEELALKISEQLEGRRVLRTWRRRAAQHAGGRRRHLEALMDADADTVLRHSRLARTFYHWRTHSFVRRRYNVDRRRCLPAAAPSTAGVKSSITHLQLLRITGGAGVAHNSGADSRDQDSERPTSPAAVARLPPPPRAAASKPAPPQRSQQGRVEYARRAPYTRSPQGSSDRCSNATAVRQSTAVAVASLEAPENTGLRGNDEEGPAAAPAIPHVDSRTVRCRQFSIPLRKRTLALQRQLLAVQLQHPLLFSTHASVRVITAGRRAMPPARAVFSEPPSSTVLAPRRTTRPRTPPPTNTVDQHWDSNLSGSDAEIEAPTRSCTATPLFAAREVEHARRPLCNAALVESPHSPSSLQPRPPQSGNHLRGSEGCAALGSGFEPAAPTNRLLGKMEQLLRRIRSMEDGYPAQGAAAT